MEQGNFNEGNAVDTPELIKFLPIQLKKNTISPEQNKSTFRCMIGKNKSQTNTKNLKVSEDKNILY